MAERTNGGVFYGNVLTGTLKHFVVDGPGFNGAIDASGTPVYNSAAEIVFQEISKRATIAIMNPLRLNNDGMAFALETNRADWTAAELQEMIRALGTIGVDNVDVSGATVIPIAYGTGGAGSGGSSTFLELTDTPSSYASSEDYILFVNTIGDAVEFRENLFLTDITNESIGDLDDVNISGLGVGQIIEWDGSQFIPGDKVGTGATTFVGLTDTPGSYAGAANQIVIVNALENSLEFIPAPTVWVRSVFGREGIVVATAGDYDAIQVDFNNIASGLTAINVQSAIDEVDGRVDSVETDSHTHLNKAVLDLITNAGSGLVITTGERTLLGTALQAGDNISVLTNDAGYVTAITAPVTQVFGRTGAVVAVANDYTALQITFDPSSSSLTAISVQGAIVETIGRVDLLDTDAHTHLNKAVLDLITNAGSGLVITTGERTLLGTATQPGDNVSDLTNDAGYVTAITAPVTQVFGRTGAVVAVANDYLASQVSNNSGVIGLTVAAALDQLESDIGTIDLGTKADKIIPTTVGDFAGLSADGNLIDSGTSVSDFATSAQGVSADTALQDITSESIGDLSDVDLSGIIIGQIIEWDGSQFIPGAKGGGGEAVDSVFGRIGTVVAVDDDYTSSQITFNPITSGLTATDVQAAIDEVEGRVDSVETDSHTHLNKAVLDLITNAGSGLVITTGERTLLGTATQPGDNVSDLTNDAGYVTAITSPVISVNTKTGAVVLDTDDISEGTNLYFTNARADARVTYESLNTNSDVGTSATQVAQGDHVHAIYQLLSEKSQPGGYASLDVAGTVPLVELPDSIQGGLQFQGMWNADTNTPTLVSGVGTQSHYYIVNVAGSTLLDGVSTWNLNDQAVFNGVIWERSPTTGGVSTVFGRSGTIVALAGDYNAIQIDYDNATSALIATTAQAAIDEVESRVDVNETNITALQGSTHSHSNKAVLDLITDAGSGLVITATERTLLGTATQPGDNVSDLTNDAGYLIPGDNVSDLTNDAGYLIPGDNVSDLTNDAGYITASEVPADAVTSVFTRTGAIVALANDYTALQITYNPATSLLTATDAQAAIDEVEARVDVNETNITALQAVPPFAPTTFTGIGTTGYVPDPGEIIDPADPLIANVEFLAHMDTQKITSDIGQRVQPVNPEIGSVWFDGNDAASEDSFRDDITFFGGGCMGLDGGAAKTMVSNAQGTIAGDVCVEGRVHLVSLAERQTLFIIKEDNKTFMMCGVEAATGEMFIVYQEAGAEGGGSTKIDTGHIIAIGTWYHIALQGLWDNPDSRILLFVDGVLVHTENVIAEKLDYIGYDVVIGSAYPWSKQDWTISNINGRIDEVRVTKDKRYIAGFTPLSVPFDDGTLPPVDLDAARYLDADGNWVVSLSPDSFLTADATFTVGTLASEDFVTLEDAFKWISTHLNVNDNVSDVSVGKRSPNVILNLSDETHILVGENGETTIASFNGTLKIRGTGSANCTIDSLSSTLIFSKMKSVQMDGLTLSGNMIVRFQSLIVFGDHLDDFKMAAGDLTVGLYSSITGASVNITTTGALSLRNYSTLISDKDCSFGPVILDNSSILIVRGFTAPTVVDSNNSNLIIHGFIDVIDMFTDNSSLTCDDSTSSYVGSSLHCINSSEVVLVNNTITLTASPSLSRPYVFSGSASHILLGTVDSNSTIVIDATEATGPVSFVLGCTDKSVLHCSNNSISITNVPTGVTAVSVSAGGSISFTDLPTITLNGGIDYLFLPGDVQADGSVIWDSINKLPIPTTIGELTDVDLSGVTINQILEWDGSKFIVVDNTFILSSDTPGDYSSASLKAVAVNAGETALEFVNFPVTSVFGRTGDVTATLNDYAAVQVSFDNSFSSLTSLDVQNACNVLSSRTDANAADIDTLEIDTHTHSNKAVLDLITDAGSGLVITTGERTTLGTALQPTDSIDALSDVDTTTAIPAINQILEWNGSDFTPVNKLVTESQVTDLNRVRWANVWTEVQYQTNDMVFDDPWTMVANKPTTERASPQADGAPVWAIGTEAVFLTSSTVGVIISGHTYTFTEGGWLYAVYAYVPELTEFTNYRFIIKDITVPETPVIQVINDPLLSENAWQAISVGNHIIRNGTILEIYIDAFNSNGVTEINGGWTYNGRSNNGDPDVPYGWNVNNGRSILRIAEVDLNDISYAIQFSSIVSNTTVSFIQTSDITKIEIYEILGIGTNEGGFWTWPCTRTSADNGGVGNSQACTTKISIPLQQSTEYSRQDTYWSVNPPSFAVVEGLLEFNGVPQAGATDAVFGIDIKFQPALIPVDWDIVTTIGAGASGGRQGIDDAISDVPGPGSWSRTTGLWVLTINDITNESIDDLSNVTITTPIDGNYLVYQTGSWINSPSVINVHGRTGAIVALAGDYNAIQIDYDNATSALIATTAQAAIDEVESRVDVTETNITALQGSTHSHSNKAVLDLITDAGSGLVITATERTALGTALQDITSESIDDLSDVDVTTASPKATDTLVWNGTNWVPGPSIEYGIAVPAVTGYKDGDVFFVIP